MKIAQKYSHLNGEFLLFYKKENNVDIFVLDFSEYK